MKHINGAQRPTSTCNVLWIAVVAVFLVVATAAAAFSQYTENSFGMGSDNVMGMMPPNGMYPPPDSGGQRRMPTSNCNPARDIKLTQTAHHHTFTYVSTKHGCVYTIRRNRKAWATVTYDASSGTYKLTDPNGTGRLILELGIAPGQFATPRLRPGMAPEKLIKVTPSPVATP